MLSYERYNPTANETSNETLKNTKEFILNRLNEKFKRKRKKSQEKDELKYIKKQKNNREEKENKKKSSISDIPENNLQKIYQKKDINSSNPEHLSVNDQIQISCINTKKETENISINYSELDWFLNPTKISLNLKLPLDNNSIHLSDQLKRQLKSKDYNELFPVQIATIPLILNNSNIPKGDLFVGAPTGSGKTLAYAIPIIQMLLKRKITRLRCIVILPTKELVSQVYECFKQCTNGTGLKIGISTGKRSFIHEQSKLIGNTEQLFAGGQSLVDILICTPGRLVDHIQNSPNFSLQHLKYLVIDEADRLLSQRFQNWIEIVMNEIETPKSYKDSNYKTIMNLPDAVNDPLKLIFGNDFSMDRKPYITQKLIFSATLTCNPEKIASLRLREPRLILIEESEFSKNQCLFRTKTSLQNDDISTFFVPPTLTEYAILIESNAKPLYLYYLIESKKMEGVLCFTKSNESAARLYKLLTFIHKGLTFKSSGLNTNNNNTIEDPSEIFELFTNEIPKKQRNIALEKFKNGNIKIFICSDLIARGIDLQVFHVINYDIPLTSRQYIHRVGRTARAGKFGETWTLYQDFESKKIQKILKNIGRKTEIIYEKMSTTIFTNEYIINYKLALEKLKEDIKEKKNN
ncbi:hypothetical protein PCANB_000837 [Pneumocystis canis]|nr:hypothetical protein PCANB_000837 [Pneumocystis canis]